MSLWKYTQRTFNGGVLDRELMGRQDLSKYFCGASLLKNFLVRRQGNLAKRRGTDFVAGLANLLGHRTLDGGTTVYDTVGKSRLIPLVQEREKGYYALLCGKRAFLVDRDRGILHADGTWRRSVQDYLFVPNHTTRRYVGSFVCKIGDVAYDTLADAAACMSDGDVIKLVRDAEVSEALDVKGKLDLNGHTLLFASESAVLKFGTTAGQVYGLYSGRNLNAPSGFVRWKDGLDTTQSVVPIVHDKPGSLVVQNVDVAFPFTETNAYLMRSASALGHVSVKGCTITAACRIADIGGTDADSQCDVEIADSSVCSTYASYVDAAFNNGTHAANNRKVVFKSGTMDVAGCSVANYGFRLDGGRLVCRSFGTANDGAGYNKAIRGLVSVKLSANHIDANSEYKGTQVVDGVTYYVYGRTAASLAAAPLQSFASASVEAEEEETPAPYYVEVPYEDGDLADLDAFQSGDTLFLAHKGYAPAKLSFDAASMSLAYETLVFNGTTWKRPVITNKDSSVNLAKSELSKSGSTNYRITTSYTENAASGTYTKTQKCEGKNDSASTWNEVSRATSTLPARTVSYVVTYVKDGVESAPSNPVDVTYAAPWEQGGKVALTFGRGSNDEEPDYYNVYKKESTEYGLIGSTTKTGIVDAFPEISGVQGRRAGLSTAPVATATFNGSSLKEISDNDLLGASETDAVTRSASRVVGVLGTYGVWRGVGGVSFGDGSVARFDFGENSGLSIGEVELCLDAHTLRYVEDAATGKVKVYDDMRLSGKRVSVSVTYTSKQGEQTAQTHTVSKTLDAVSYTPEGGSAQTAYSGLVTHYCGSVYPGATFDEVKALVGREVRRATFSFGDVVDGTKQVSRIVVTCEDDVGGASAQVVCFLCGVTFSNAGATENTFDDDYITPDLSITPPSEDSAFRGRGNYPSCVGLYQQRLIFAATADQPFGFWMSAVGDLYNFSPHASIREDDAISAELAATEFPNVNHIVMNRDIIMLGDGGEWKIAPVTGNTITYKTISAELQSSIGSAKWLKPITIGEQVVFAERTGMALRSIAYNFSSDGYESKDLSVLSGNLFADNRIERMCYKQHPDSTIECVLADGTVAAMVYMPEHEVAAWSQCVLGGGYGAKDIASSKALNGNTTDVLLTVRKGSETELWTVRPDLPEKTVDAQTCMDRVQRLTAAEASSGWVSGWTAVDRATGASVASAAGLVAGHEYLCGFTFDSEVVTVRPEPSGRDTIQFEIKNARSAEVRVVDSGSFSVRGFDVSAERATAVSTGFSMAGGVHSEKDFDVMLCGKNTRDGRVSIKSTDPLPCNILSVSVTYQIEAADQNGSGE